MARSKEQLASICDPETNWGRLCEVCDGRSHAMPHHSRLTGHRQNSPRGIARFDSAAGMAQTLGSYLHGEEFRSLTGSGRLDRMLPLVNLLPERPREWFYSFAGMVEGVWPRELPRLDFEGIANWLVGLYPKKSYPSAFVGSSNGAIVHLAAALGVPWLPQTFLCPVRHLASDPDDARTGFSAGLPFAQALTEAAPDMAVHHMQDPNQDRLMLRTMSYYRLKHRRLPDAFRQALAEWLPRAATLYSVECTKTWPVTRTGPRSVFQFGALGGATIDEYFHGGERVRAYLARYRVRRERWEPPEPNDEAPEAEWGFEPALLEDLQQMARIHGWRLVRIRCENPEALSDIAAAAFQDWYHALGLTGPFRLIVDSFVLMAPLRAQRLRAVPFWLLFGVDPSAEHLERFLSGQRPFDEVDIMLFSHGTEGVGVAPIDAWRRLAACGRRPGRLLGVDPQRYPRDFATFARFHRDLEKLGPVLPELPPPLPLDRFESLLRSYAKGSGIELSESTP
ncbi:MAG: hypothetical protein JO110_07025 [Acetobacteraceae bacterium]|nr:hypothetical protein [Acetobacteraceae bacterium]